VILQWKLYSKYLIRTFFIIDDKWKVENII
jgi:hypothetical protein